VWKLLAAVSASVSAEDEEMGWSVHYRAVIDGAVSGADRELLAEQTEKWTGQLHEGSESYWWEILDSVKAARIFDQRASRACRSAPDLAHHCQ
jgi:hypothetical protein